MRVHVELLDREVELIDEPIAKGGEAKLHLVETGYEDAPLIAKIFDSPADGYAAKIEFMIANPPMNLRSHTGQFQVAWPLYRLFQADDPSRFLGYVMPYVAQAKQLNEVFIPLSRRKLKLPDRVDFLMQTAINLVEAVHAIHGAGYVIGDLSPANVLVRRGTVILVDVDSYQVSDGDVIYRCKVGTEEYTPPELQRKVFAAVDRKQEHDNFGLAALRSRAIPEV